ncbi:serine/threonine protein kinase [Silicimonas algicola]|uniref:Serine/threonine protein kinase n=1 Tax=Silicimonas algicola TaxID=1826607 RepID=A0A316GMS0_9RHOB|nr:serine/threonine-protein kinase [Silicimonas algicola]PWK56207.1 serine/threonine protein kinase [Silicimonas algicola]
MDAGPQHHDTGHQESFADALKPGTELLHGQFRIEKFLNAGGFGMTYLARDSLDRIVVIKECFPSSMCCRNNGNVMARSRQHQAEFDSVVKHFGAEARRLSKLQHQNIVGIHQVFEDNMTAYMALDFVRGRDLLDTIEDPRMKLHPRDVKDILLKCLEAVHYIHTNDVLHRDISPDNILIDGKGNPVLIDFGAAKEEATRASRALSALHVVKDGYSPHEFYIAGSTQDASSDLYSLGATFYHVLTGAAPPDSQARVSSIAADRPDPYQPVSGRFPQFEDAFLHAIDKALSVFPPDRLQSAREWIELVDTERRRSAALAQAELDRRIELSISRLVQETNRAVEADIKAQETKQAAERKEAQRLQKLVEEQARQRKKTLDELAMLDDHTFMEQQDRAREYSAQRSANKAHDSINGTPRKKRSLLSRVLPFGLLRGTFRSGRRSDYL